MPHVLIVAYGNPLRSDDGVAWRAADALSRKFPKAEVEILCFHQLAPELAETVSRFAAVIFIDAASPRQGADKPGEVQIERIGQETIDHKDATPFSHVLTPHTVVALATTLYGAKLRASLVTVTGENFEHGESLSGAVAAALPELISKIGTIVEAALSTDRLPPGSHRP